MNRVSAMFLALSAICTCFSGIQPVAIASWLQPFFLLESLDRARLLHLPWPRLLFILFVTLMVQSAASFFAFLGCYEGIGLSWASSLFIALGISVVVAMATMVPYLVTMEEVPSSLALASADVCVYLDFNVVLLQLVITSQLWGIDGINFLTGYFAAVAHDRYVIRRNRQVSSREMKQHETQAKAFSALFVLSFLYGGLHLAPLGGNLIKETAKPMLQASCIVAKVFPEYETLQVMLNRTEARVEAGDKIVLWSESGVYVNGAQAEQQLLLQAGEILKRKGSPGVYVDVTYDFFDEDLKVIFNTFALLVPNGTLGFRYRKSHPVPFVEDDVMAGEAEIPVLETEYGRIGGVICFDFQFPDFIRQQKVDIMLQPVQTWGTTGLLLYRGDMFRAIENGFTWFRCASEGVSAVMDPSSKVWEYREEASSIVLPMEFPVPSKRMRTIYADFGGFIFPWLTMVLVSIQLLLLSLPLARLQRLLDKYPRVCVVYITGHENAVAFSQTLD